MPAFLSLFEGNKLNVAVLADFAVGGKSQIERIRKSKLLSDERILLVSSFTGTAEADVEDLLGEDIYSALVNAAFDLPEPQKITAAKLAGVTGVTRIVKKVETLFKVMPPTIKEFDHLSPALVLLSGPHYLADTSPATAAALQRFEKFFETVNSFLPK